MKRFLRVTAEQVYGTYDTTSPDFAYYDPQDGDNAFKVMTSRPMWSIRDPALNVPRVTGSEVYSVGARWSGKAYWENYKTLFLPLRVNSLQTTPWPTDQRPNDLASFTCDFGYTYYDLTVKRMRALGVKVGGSWEFSARSDPANPFLMFNYDLVGSKTQPNAITTTTGVDEAPDATAFPEPTYSDLPVIPFSFFQAAISSHSTALNYVDSFSIRGQQLFKPYYDNQRFVNRISHQGRTVTLTLNLRLDGNDMRYAYYEAVTAIGATTITFTKPGGGHTLVMNFRSKSYIQQLDENFPLNEDSYASVSATAFLDSSPGDDFTITYA